MINALLCESERIFELYGTVISLDNVPLPQWDILHEREVTIDRFNDVITNALRVLKSKEYLYVSEWLLNSINVVDSDAEIFALKGEAVIKNCNDRYMVEMLNVDYDTHFCRPIIHKEIIRTVVVNKNSFSNFCETVNYFL